MPDDDASHDEFSVRIDRDGIDRSLVNFGRVASQVTRRGHLPEAIVATGSEGRLRPAMTYIAPAMQTRPADPAYVERIARPAEKFRFPAGYVNEIRSFG